MDLKCINPATMAAPGGHYSHAVVAGNMVFISGQLPINAAGEKLVNATFAEQTEQVLANLAAALQAAGSGVDRLAQVRVYVTDIAHWPEFNRLYAAWCAQSANEHRPARAVVPVPALHFGLLIEIEAVAALR